MTGVKRFPATAYLAAALLLAATSIAVAQTEAVVNPEAELRELVDRGFYNAAAQLAGPAWVEAEPTNPDAHLGLAQAAWLSGDLEAARAATNEAFSLLGDTTPPADLLNMHGLLLHAEGQVDAGLDTLQQAFNASGAYRHAMDLARVAWLAGRYDIALEAYAQAAATPQGQQEAWPLLNRARLLDATGDVEAALTAFRETVVTFDRLEANGSAVDVAAFVEAYTRMGQLLERLGEVDEAREAYLTARRALPTYTPAIAALDALREAED
jgi:tetratricopeptide (TPR) repeat protein